MPARDDRQQLVHDWVLRCFGTVGAHERAMRLLEEALELAQAVGVHVDDAVALAWHVFGKEPGEPYQEAGGVAVTLLAFCASQGMKADEVEFAEIRRILAKSPDHFRRRQNLKAAAGVAVALPEDRS